MKRVQAGQIALDSITKSNQTSPGSPSSVEHAHTCCMTRSMSLASTPVSSTSSPSSSSGSAAAAEKTPVQTRVNEGGENGHRDSTLRDCPSWDADTVVLIALAVAWCPLACTHACMLAWLAQGRKHAATWVRIHWAGRVLATLVDSGPHSHGDAEKVKDKLRHQSEGAKEFKASPAF